MLISGLLGLLVFGDSSDGWKFHRETVWIDVGDEICHHTFKNGFGWSDPIDVELCSHRIIGQPYSNYDWSDGYLYLFLIQN